MAVVLIIEDNDPIRENVSELFEMSGHNVISACNGSEGLILAKTKNPDIIFCDIQLPIMNGYEILASLKLEKHTAKIPFIFLTSACEKKEIATGMALGANAYIIKPFSIEELTETICSYCENK